MDLHKSAVGRAGGKVILLGEHAVVHGSESVAFGLAKGVEVIARRAYFGFSMSIPALRQRFRRGDGSREGEAIERLVRALGLDPDGVEMDASIDIPSKAGLGSSAALAAAAARALVSLFEIEITSEDLFNAVQESERVFHGDPSGLDASVALGGGMVAFSRSKGPRPISVEIPPVLVFHSGEQGDTRAMVSRFAKRLVESGDEGRTRLREIYSLVEQGISALKNGDLESLGRAMNESHRLLDWFGMSTPALDRIVDSAMEAGALGAKLTGAGGGGCVVALVEPGDGAVARRLLDMGISRVDV
jgi:mevalonate kinase